jgi:2-C-methyl-D-erythritol 4-phosphate cytidylyltransferase
MTHKRYAVVVAAGSGKRMGAPLPKQFLLLKGRPILMHTLERLREFDALLNIIVVIHPDYISYWKECIEQHQFAVTHEVVAGGEERFHSVKNALLVISDTSALVAIHDGVRPLVSTETLQRCFEMADEAGNAVPVVAINDSIREADGVSNRAVDRSKYRIVQTPQCFRMSVLADAFKQEYTGLFTDDASVVEAAGNVIHLVEGNRENIKITNPEDLRWAEWMLSSR